MAQCLHPVAHLGCHLSHHVSYFQYSHLGHPHIQIFCLFFYSVSCAVFQINVMIHCSCNVPSTSDFVN
jgi:hypothetical protein